MLEYVLGSEKWNPPNGYRRFHLKYLWCDLLGMNYFVSELWGDNKKSVIKEMKQHLIKGIRTGSLSSGMLVRMYRFRRRGRARWSVPKCLREK